MGKVLGVPGRRQPRPRPARRGQQNEDPDLDRDRRALHCSFDDSRCEERAERLSLESSRQGNTLEVRVDGMSSVSALRFHIRGRILVPQGRALEVDLPAVAVNLGVGELGVTLD